jgi:hypothetical protein
MNDITILDDFLPPYIQHFLEEGFYNNMSLTFIKKTLPHIKDSEYFDDEQLECWIKHPTSENSLALGNSHFYLLPLQIGCLNLGINLKLENLYRAKLNITLNSTSSPSKINPPHIDGIDMKPYFIAIYYVNDSDGDTIIYDGDDEDELQIIKTITPKKGRLILMDGKRYHSSSHPSKTKKRIVMNYNILY